MSNTDWFHAAGWGAFTHYLGGDDESAAEWNARVDAFDVARLADQIESTGAPYYFITIGQNSGHYCAPNAAYDSFVQIAPSKCSRRDLVADLYEALAPRGIKLLVYLPSGAPASDPVAKEGLEWQWGYEGDWPYAHSGERTGLRLASFQRKWEAVIREWSERWGERVCGWWFDGCYFADEMYRHADAPNFESLADATRAGNPASLVAFNPGVVVPVICHSEHEDYTAGEIAELFPTCPGRWIEGAQYHILSYLGWSWCKGEEPRLPDEFVIGYTKHVTSRGGVITWDVPILPDGVIPDPFVRQLAALGKAMQKG